MQIAANVAEQVNQFEEELNRYLLQEVLIIEQMLDPTLYSNDIENYPLDWSSAEALTFKEILE